MKKLIIFGAGHYSKMIYNDLKYFSEYKILGFFDERENLKSKKKDKFIKINKNLKKYKNLYGVIAVGDNYKRYKIHQIISKKLSNIRWIVYKSKSAVISKNTKIGEGTVILPNAVINSGTKIGKHCIINTSCSIDHDNKFDSFTSTGPRVTTAGNVTIKKFSFIGISSTINSKITIHKNTIVGGNSFVSKNCVSNSIYFGVPAKLKRKRRLGEEYLD
jgi:sugar O-acyltransferase (sialic acid O-acetyltransferase NeuD family)